MSSPVEVQDYGFLGLQHPGKDVLLIGANRPDPHHRTVGVVDRAHATHFDSDRDEDFG